MNAIPHPKPREENNDFSSYWRPSRTSKKAISSPNVLDFPNPNNTHRSKSPSIYELSDDDRVLSELANILISCKNEGWDGYNALPITQSSSDITLDFINLILADGYNFPAIVPDPTGKIAMIWENEKNELIITINSSRKIIFSMSNKSNGYLYGVHEFKNDIPLEVLSLIKMLH